ncbi:MAG: PKD domain-containing protein [Acidobacteriota bacterium]
MKGALIALVLTLAILSNPAAHAAMPSKVLLLSGLGYSNPDTAFETWVTVLGQSAIVGKPNLKATSFAAYAASVKTEIREAYEKSNHQKIGVIAHSVAATAVFDAILKDKAIRETMVSRAVLISPLVSGIDADAHDIGGVLTYTGMSGKLEPTLEKGSNYFAAFYTLIKNTAARIRADPTLMNKYPRLLIVTSKDDGLIPMSASNPTILQFVLGLKIRLGLRHGPFVTGKRPILDIKDENDAVYKLSTLFLADDAAWEKIGRDPLGKDRGEVVFKVKGQSAYLKQNGETTQIDLKQNEVSKRYYLENLEPARYHVFVDGVDGGEIAVGPAQMIYSPAPIPGQQAPVARFTANPNSGPVPFTTSLDGSNSSDADGSIVSWEWTFGDGQKGTGVIISHTYQREGNYLCRLTVTDDDDLTGTAEAFINVTGPNKPPVASFTVTPTQGDTNTTFALNGTASTDPDGTIIAYEWDFGDNSAKASGATTTHKYSANGTYSAVLKVTDNKGATDTETQQIKVTLPNQPPSAILSATGGGSQNPLKVVVILTASDSDGYVASATLDFGDGASGSITPGTAYSHTYAQAGVFTIVGTATDNLGATTTSNTLKVYDVDGDKYASQYLGDIRGSDCNDNDASVHPGAFEAPADHKDSNCNGFDDW